MQTCLRCGQVLLVCLLLPREEALGSFCRCRRLAAQISELLVTLSSTSRATVEAGFEELYGILCHEALLRCRGLASAATGISSGIASGSGLSANLRRPRDRPRELSANGSIGQFSELRMGSSAATQAVSRGSRNRARGRSRSWVAASRRIFRSGSRA